MLMEHPFAKKIGHDTVCIILVTKWDPLGKCAGNEKKQKQS
jgi:hypothetical protein